MKNPLLLSFCASALVHLALFASLPGIRVQKATGPEYKNLEIVPEEPVELQNVPEIEQPEQSLAAPPQFLEELVRKAIFDSPTDFTFDKPTLDAPAKEIFFSDLDMKSLDEIKKTPAYMDYYSMIREKIRDNALRGYTQAIQGIVRLSFIILNDGTLYKLSLQEDSSGGDRLYQLAMNSIRRSAPFPPFPTDLNYPKLHFSVSIHFKNN